MGQSSSSPVGSANDVKTLNANEQGTRQDALSGVLNTAGSYDNLLKQLMGGMSGQQTAVNNAAQSYDPTAATNAFISMNPQLQGIASQAAQTALSPYGESASQLANTATRDALRATSDQLGSSGLLNTGAANSSLMQAALAPQQQLQTNLAGMSANYQGNMLNSLLGQTGSQLASGYSQQGAQNLNAAQTNAQNYLSGMGLAGQYTGQQGDLYSQLANLTQQQYWQPQYQKNPGLFDYMGLGVQGLGAVYGK